VHACVLRADAEQPLYVAAESFKFTRMYPLNQRDPALEAAASRFLRDNKQLVRLSLCCACACLCVCVSVRACR
jgi:translation initiation factor 2B subunit (eIF-2B alpha/beta/delta family)